MWWRASANVVVVYAIHSKKRQIGRIRRIIKTRTIDEVTYKQTGASYYWSTRTWKSGYLKPGFHMSGKSQAIGDFTFFRPCQILPIYRICARGLFQIFLIMNYLFVIGGLEPSNFEGLVMSEIHRRRMPMSGTVQIWVFICREWIADHRRNLGRVGKIAHFGKEW